jgi:tRNA-specific 2-thiouridylase
MAQLPTVFVGLSGGVDSSVAALRLKKQGYRVVGVFIKVWHPEFMVCNWEAERLDAMRVAAHLGIPFLTCDAETTYKKAVADYFIAEYSAGRTPNPDVLCNQAVKFGTFLTFAIEHQADFIATGHYAQVRETSTGPALLRGRDDNKDQSYFLWSLSSQQLSRALFPVGDTAKDLIREEAKRAGLPIATKRDSQGVCFLGHVDIPEFLSHYVTLTPGAVLDESGRTIGSHVSALVYTLGQRHGFTLATNDSRRGHYYVIAKNLADNTITVSTIPLQVSTTKAIALTNTVFRTEPKKDTVYSAQFRYRQAPVPVTVTVCENNEADVYVQSETEQPSLGQSAVIYDGDTCLGGGIIST